MRLAAVDVQHTPTRWRLPSVPSPPARWARARSKRAGRERGRDVRRRRTLSEVGKTHRESDARLGDLARIGSIVVRVPLHGSLDEFATRRLDPASQRGAAVESRRSARRRDELRNPSRHEHDIAQALLVDDGNWPRAVGAIPARNGVATANGDGRAIPTRLVKRPSALPIVGRRQYRVGLKRAHTCRRPQASGGKCTQHRRGLGKLSRRRERDGEERLRIRPIRFLLARALPSGATKEGKRVVTPPIELQESTSRNKSLCQYRSGAGVATASACRATRSERSHSRRRHS